MSPGTRTLRLTAPQFARLHEHLGSQVQVVLKDGQTRLGILRSVVADHLVIHDPNLAWYQRRRHTHKVMFGSIQEVWIDTARPW